MHNPPTHLPSRPHTPIQTGIQHITHTLHQLTTSHQPDLCVQAHSSNNCVLQGYFVLAWLAKVHLYRDAMACGVTQAARATKATAAVPKAASAARAAKDTGHTVQIHTGTGSIATQEWLSPPGAIHKGVNPPGVAGAVHEWLNPPCTILEWLSTV
jgi:hypothetical protein